MTDTTHPNELVRGNVKAAMKEAGASSADLWNVKPALLRVLDGFNGRVVTPEYEAHIESIAESILANGYYQDKPIAGFVADEDGERVIYVTEGHTRHAAVLRAIGRGAPVETVPVVIKPKGTTMEDLTVALVTSNNGRPFTPYETALIVKRLIDMGMPEKVVAQRLGFSRGYVNDLLSLVGAPKAVRDMVVAGQVSATVATKAVKQHGGKAAGHLKSGLAVAKGAGKARVTAQHLREKNAPVPRVDHAAEIARLKTIVAEVHSWAVANSIGAAHESGEHIIKITDPTYQGEAL